MLQDTLFLLQADRGQLFECFPQGGVVAEIGVATGDFSEYLLNTLKPTQLHLVDPWEFQDRSDYEKDINNVCGDEAEDRFQGVLNRFAQPISEERIQVHRQYSHDAATGFEDNYFDVVYIDAMHTYESCLQDLRAYAPKVKDDGFICGHDFANHAHAKYMNFGVVEAVQEFLRETGYHFVALTHENYPTYVIAKTATSENFMSMMGEISYRFDRPTLIRNPKERTYEQIWARYSDGTYKFIPCFG